ncbi:hypothetical protein RIF29_09929 [Crotalaria pallida]|uniref:BHLH domain-containing protein n=1 Tax=Crotalaria pallida TaxID=3830 RepID=A0AAN9IJU9_CROPI
MLLFLNLDHYYYKVLRITIGSHLANFVGLNIGDTGFRVARLSKTDPHSIAERLRREKIAERIRALQELVPSVNKSQLVPTPPHYGEKITRLEEELVEKNKEIGDIRATLQAVLDHLGMTMPEAHSMRTTESSVHLADDHVDDFVDGDGDGDGGDDDGDDHVPPTL